METVILRRFKEDEWIGVRRLRCSREWVEGTMDFSGGHALYAQFGLRVSLYNVRYLACTVPYPAGTQLGKSKGIPTVGETCLVLLVPKKCLKQVSISTYQRSKDACGL